MGAMAVLAAHTGDFREEATDCLQELLLLFSGLRILEVLAVLLLTLEVALVLLLLYKKPT